MLKVYAYKNCSSCQKALKYLQGRKISFELHPIVESPPTREELRRMAGYVGGYSKLFNTSGQLYRQLGLSGKALSDTEALDLLAAHGKLIKRPFALAANRGAVGFKQEVWDQFSES
ncbi:Spx/MgsR family RNA polymerase-binding regulatory protein [bacterium]|nr:Spx/MgsR family RNA polymerase-binding regulatory protein [bacterium]